MTPEEQLAKINAEAAQLQKDFESFKSAEIPVGVMEDGAQDSMMQTPDVNGLETDVRGTMAAGTTAREQLDKFLQQQVEAEQKSLSSVGALQQSLAGRAGEFEELYQRDVAPARETLNAINRRIAKRTAQLEQFDDQTFLGEENLRLDASGRDMTKASFGAEATRRRLDRAVTRTGAAAEIRADMAEAEFLQGNIESALDEINMSLDARYAADEQALEFEKERLKTLSDRATGAQKSQIDMKMQAVEQEQNDISDAKALVATVAQAGYASPEEVRVILSTDLSPQEQLTQAMEILTRGAAEDRQREYAMEQQRLVKSTGNVVSSSISADVGSLMASPELGSESDPMLAVLEATAGGRALTQSETEPLTNARRVVGQLDTIINTVVSTETDPILGIIRSSNPYDVKATELEAALTALVPQLARGIYGEVGVLTDSDVERYVRTLPNIRNTEQVNKAVAALTLRNVRSAFVAQLESMAAAGRDVSGFIGIYQNMNNQINTLESELGIDATAGADIDKEFEDMQKEIESNSRGVSSMVAGQGSLGYLDNMFDWQAVGDFFFGKD